MPPSLKRQILDHYARQHYELRIDFVENGVVGEVEAVCDFDGQPA